MEKGADAAHYYVEEMELNRLGYDLLSSPDKKYALEAMRQKGR